MEFPTIVLLVFLAIVFGMACFKLGIDQGTDKYFKTGYDSGFLEGLEQGIEEGRKRWNRSAKDVLNEEDKAAKKRSSSH
jgi:flagellar biosynthesis/type III secretory pathway protein FliH